jgi:hypothetical protein
MKLNDRQQTEIRLLCVASNVIPSDELQMNETIHPPTRMDIDLYTGLLNDTLQQTASLIHS